MKTMTWYQVTRDRMLMDQKMEEKQCQKEFPL
jgi:hypothetical protein